MALALLALKVGVTDVGESHSQGTRKPQLSVQRGSRGWESMVPRVSPHTGIRQSCAGKALLMLTAVRYQLGIYLGREQGQASQTLEHASSTQLGQQEAAARGLRAAKPKSH